MFNVKKNLSFNYWHQRIQEAAFTPQAFWLCILVAFFESSFFPIPPDVMIIPMVLSNRKIAFKIALCCTISSVLGGLLGYYIGYAFFETIGQWIVSSYSLESALVKFQVDFANYGFWIIVLKGLTPIPFKLVTIASGIAQFDLFQFTVASFIARSFRFYMLCTLLWWAGPMLKPYIESKMKWVMGLTMLGIVLGFVIVKLIYS